MEHRVKNLKLKITIKKLASGVQGGKMSNCTPSERKKKQEK